MPYSRDGIQVSTEGSVAFVIIDRPAKRNALSLSMWRNLREVFEELADNNGTRAVILSGSGGHFCSGADISEFDSNRSDAQSGQAYEREAEAAVRAVRDWPGPTIAAISGYAVGGGCGLALACDFRVGDQSARMGIPAARLGIVYGLLDCELLYRQVGLAHAKYILYSARIFKADEAKDLGLLDFVATTDALSAARDLALEFADNAPLTLRGSKFILEACADGTAHAKSAEIQTLLDASIESADYAEGRRAFTERRKPVFLGR